MAFKLEPVDRPQVESRRRTQTAPNPAPKERPVWDRSPWPSNSRFEQSRHHSKDRSEHPRFA